MGDQNLLSECEKHRGYVILDYAMSQPLATFTPLSIRRGKPLSGIFGIVGINLKNGFPLDPYKHMKTRVSNVNKAYDNRRVIQFKNFCFTKYEVIKIEIVNKFLHFSIFSTIYLTKYTVASSDSFVSFYSKIYSTVEFQPLRCHDAVL